MSRDLIVLYAEAAMRLQGSKIAELDKLWYLGGKISIWIRDGDGGAATLQQYCQLMDSRGTGAGFRNRMEEVDSMVPRGGSGSMLIAC